MSGQTKRTGAIVAVLACVLAIGMLGYWLGRQAAAPVQPKPASKAPYAATRPSVDAKPLTPPRKPRDAATAKQPESLSATSIPLKWRFAGITQYEVGSNTESWLSQYADHADLIVRFNQRHPYAWNVTSAEEIAWLARNGFPMPEDVIAAEAMSDEDLRKAADAGSGKALLFYFERLQQEWIDAARAEIAGGASVSEAMQRLNSSMSAQEQEMGRIGGPARQLETPFVGYMEANRPFIDDNETVRQQNLAGGLALAYARGDDRAATAIVATAANGQMPEEWASMAHRVMTDMRDYFSLSANCDSKISPFPKPVY